MTDYPYKYSIYPDTPVYPKQTFKIPLIFRGSYSVKVVDLSYHQDPKNINYDKLAAAADGFILRGAYGTGVDGKWSGPDPALEEHFWNLHTKRDKPCGIYHFIVAYKTIEEQVKVMLEAVGKKKWLMGKFNDVETEQGATPLRAQHVIDYMTQAEDAMGRFKLYAARWCWQAIMGEHINDYSDRSLWMAAYTTSPDKYIPHGWTNWDLWQYTGTGSMPGYSRAIDISYFRGDKEQFKIWIGETSMATKLILTPLSQKDPKWASEKLGTSVSTIGSHGCLITNLAMVAKYYGINTDPSKVNKELIRVNGYANTNNLIFAKAEEACPGLSLDFISADFSSDRIDNALANKIPVIAMVDYDPSDADIDQHWVTINGKNGDDYTITDPIDGKERKLSDKYGKKLYKIAIYSGIPVPPVEETILFKVKVMIPDLVIRSGAGTLYPVVYRYAFGEYGILEEKIDAFSGMLFGRIDIGKWICIDPKYVQRIDPSVIDIESRVTSLESRVSALENSK